MPCLPIPRKAGVKVLLLIVLGCLLLGGGGISFYKHALGQWRLAQEDVKASRLDEAQDRLDLCLGLWPRSVSVHLLAARAARLSGHYDQAEAHLNTCLKLQNGPSEAVQVEFLLMRAQRGEEDEVSGMLLEFVENDYPEKLLILETLSRAYMHEMRYGQAYSLLKRWIELAPDSAKPYHWRGWVVERLNNPFAAREDYLEALQRDPELIAVRIRVAEMYLEDSNPVEAEPHLERLILQEPDRADVKARLGQCRYLQGRAEEARKLLESAVMEIPSDATLLITLARLELQEGRQAEAETWLRRLLEKDPFDTEAEFALNTCLHQMGRTEEAAVVLAQYKKHRAIVDRSNKLLKNEAEHPSASPATAFEIGSLLLQIGQDHLGVFWLHEALRRDAHHEPAREALADYYAKNGEPEKAASFRTVKSR